MVEDNLYGIINFRNRIFVLAVGVFLLATLLSVFTVSINPSFLPIVFLFLTAVLLITDQKHLLIILYLIYLPTNGLIDRQYFLFEAIGVQQLLALGALVMISRIKVSQPADVFKKLALWLLLLLVSYLIYTGFKNAVYNMHSATWLTAFMRLVNVSILYMPLILILGRMGNSTVLSWTYIGVFLGVLNMAIFCFLSPYLPELGFYSLGIQEIGVAIDADQYDRYTGIIGDGDSNTLGAFFVIASGFLFSHPVALRRSSLLKTLLILCTVGIALTASRTALISLGMVAVLFFSTPGKGKLKMQMAVATLLLFVLAAPIWETVLTRLTESGAEQLDTQSSGNRIGKWIIYVQHFLDHPSTFFRGASTPVFIGFNERFIVAHNFYIQVVYNAGMPFLIGFVMIYTKIFRLMLAGVGTYRMDLILLPLLAITFFVSDIGAFIYFILFFATNCVADSSTASVRPILN